MKKRKTPTKKYWWAEKNWPDYLEYSPKKRLAFIIKEKKKWMLEREKGNA